MSELEANGFVDPLPLLFNAVAAAEREHLLDRNKPTDNGVASGQEGGEGKKEKTREKREKIANGN